MQGTLPVSALKGNNVSKVSERVSRETRVYCDMRDRREREGHLHVDVSAVVDQELQAEGAVRGRGGEVERGEAFVVGLTHVGAVVNQLAHHGILAVKARYVQSRVPKRIGFVDLLEVNRRRVYYTAIQLYNGVRRGGLGH